MTRRALLAVAAVLAGAPLTAQTPPAPRFRAERAVEVAAAGPQRLDLDVALLAGARPFTVAARPAGQSMRFIAGGGLADLRLFNAAGEEVPYLQVPPPVTMPPIAIGVVLPVAATEKTSGFEADLGSAVLIDAFRMDGIPSPFMKRFRLEGSGDRERWTVLVAEGTAFDLPADQLRRTQIEFAPGPYRYLRVTWDDTNSGRVTPPAAVSARRVERYAAGPPLRAGLTFERRPSEPGRSRFRIRLPGSRLPIVALDLTVDGGYLLRDARVVEARLKGTEAVPVLVGQARLRRTVRDGLSADALRVSVQQPTEPQLDLVVDDGDNPPLELTGVTAVFAELPWIYFESPAGKLTARYGDPTLAAPRYDLEAARPELPATTAAATWGASPPATIVAEPEPLAMPETGSAIDVAGFHYVRVIPPGPEGLITIPLDGHALAFSGSVRRRFADVRVLEPSGLQMPYLLERRDEPIALDVKLERKDLPKGLVPADARRTSYVLTLPFELLPDATLAVSTRARVFERPVTLGALLPPDERRRDPRLQALDTRTWKHADPETPAGALSFAIPERRPGELYLIVDEGDNQPLPIEKATLLLPSFAIRLFRPANVGLRLAYGHNDLREPRYDLELLGPQVMGRLATEVAADANTIAAQLAPDLQLVPPAVFWAALGVAVIVLLGLVVRLVRRESADTGAAPPG